MRRFLSVILCDGGFARAAAKNELKLENIGRRLKCLCLVFSTTDDICCRQMLVPLKMKDNPAKAPRIQWRPNSNHKWLARSGLLNLVTHTDEDIQVYRS